ncbi:MAG TPA: hypothetical protein VD884_06355 [Ohtaekwangia sp.]|nr:hypothetical protein [Ohtaekwangia sp.]
MKKRPVIIHYTGSVPTFLSQKVYINVCFLKEGAYEIYLVHNGKVIKKIQFAHIRKHFNP